MPRYLVVANRTLLGGHLLDELRERARDGASFHVVVPASPPPESAVWTEGECRAVAVARLAEALATFAHHGLDATGEVGDPNPLNAIVDALGEADYDGLVLSTLPPGPSRWLNQDLPHRVARRFPSLPMVHLVAEPLSAAAH